MRKTFCLVITLSMVLISFLPTTTKSQEEDDPQAFLTEMSNEFWDKLAGWRENVEKVFNVKLESKIAYRTFQGIWPDITKAVEEATAREFGLVIKEARNGIPHLIFSSPQTANLPAGFAASPPPAAWGAAGGFMARVFGPLPAVWFAMNMNLLADNFIETKLIEYQMEAYQMDETTARQNANVITDKLRIIADPICWGEITDGVDNPCVGRIMNAIERYQERGADRPKIKDRSASQRAIPDVGGDRFIGRRGPGDNGAAPIGEGGLGTPNVTTGNCTIFGVIGEDEYGNPIWGWYEIPC